MGAVVVAVIVVPLVAAALGRLLRIPGRVWGPGAAVISVAMAVAVSLLVFAGHPVQWVLTFGDVQLAGLHADRLSALVLPLVCGISAVVQLFARRYLFGDARADYFFTTAAVLTAASAALVCAVTLVGLAVAWTIAGIALCLLLRMYPDLPPARDGAARTMRAFLVGDAALWLAVAVVVIGWGDWDLREPWPGGEVGTAAATGVAVLVVIAAASRSAQIPFQRWLPATLAAPTPVSALLHAGVVNAGAILLLRSGSVFLGVPLAAHLAFTLGAATAIYAGVLMLTKPDIKGSLAHSTMAQMGFMIMTCGLGLFAAAILHLVAHGMYKATLFLGSGAAVDRHDRHHRAPSPPPLSVRTRALVTVFAASVPAAVLAATMTVWPSTAATDQHGKTALLVFSWAAAAWASWAWMRRRPSPSRAAAATVALLAVLPAYLGIISVFTDVLRPTIPADRVGVSPWLLVPVVVIMLVVSVIRRRPAALRVSNLHADLYVWALSRAQPVARDTSSPPSATASRPVANPAMAGVSA